MANKINSIDLALAENTRQHFRRFARLSQESGCKDTCPFYHQCMGYKDNLCEVITGEHLFHEDAEADDPRQLKLFND